MKEIRRRPPLTLRTARTSPFTPEARDALSLAHTAAAELGHSYVGTEHLLLGLAREGAHKAAQALTAAGLRPAVLLRAQLDLSGRGNSGTPPFRG